MGCVHCASMLIITIIAIIIYYHITFIIVNYLLFCITMIGFLSCALP